MGYAKGSQKSNGIHLRQYSRAYVIADKKGSSRVVFVSVDACMISTLVKMQVKLVIYFFVAEVELLFHWKCCESRRTV